MGMQEKADGAWNEASEARSELFSSKINDECVDMQQPWNVIPSFPFILPTDMVVITWMPLKMACSCISGGSRNFERGFPLHVAKLRTKKRVFNSSPLLATTCFFFIKTLWLHYTTSDCSIRVSRYDFSIRVFQFWVSFSKGFSVETLKPLWIHHCAYNCDFARYQDVYTQMTVTPLGIIIMNVYTHAGVWMLLVNAQHKKLKLAI